MINKRGNLFPNASTLVPPIGVSDAELDGAVDLLAPARRHVTGAALTQISWGTVTVSERLSRFGVTIFSEMTDLARRHDAINLGQGFPDWTGAETVKDAAIASIQSGLEDQYPPSPGLPQLRDAIAGRYSPRLGQELDPAQHVTVTCGCTEALSAAFLGLIDPGDEVVLIEPYYDTYPVNASLAGATTRFVTLRPPHFRLDERELRAAFNERTRAIVINTPHNPSGRVFTREELQVVADLCVEYDVIAVADEVYEEMTYDSQHVSIASLDNMWNRSLTLSSLGKTYSLTGWKLGWAIGPSELTAGVRAAHQYLTFTTPTPVQMGAAAAMAMPDSFHAQMRAEYQAKRDLLASGLAGLGFDVFTPEGTYFLLADHTAHGFVDDNAFCRHLIERAGVAAIPPSVFYSDSNTGKSLVRFAFCKTEATLSEALERMQVLS